MYCPHCATQTAPDQKFCRACGMNVEKIAQAVTEHAGGAVTEQKPLSNFFDYDIPKLMRWVRWGAGLLGMGILMSIVGKKIVFIDLVSGVGALVGILGVGLMVYPFFAFIQLKGSSQKSGTPASLPSSQATKRQLNGRFANMIPSATERTTEFLQVTGQDTVTALNEAHAGEISAENRETAETNEIER